LIIATKALVPKYPTVQRTELRAGFNAFSHSTSLWSTSWNSWQAARAAWCCHRCHFILYYLPSWS